MKKLLSLSLLTVICVHFSAAQNLDPTVSVTRDYEGKLLEADKPAMSMQIPDSVYRFDLSFDYSVFENPFKGSYEFVPYLLDMKPQQTLPVGNKLYLKAGLGYDFAPTFKFAYTIGRGKAFRMSLFAGSDSYFGKYRAVEPLYSSDAKLMRASAGKAKWAGSDMANDAGLEGRYDWATGILTFRLGYDGIMAKDTLRTRSWNAVNSSVRLRSNSAAEQYFFYDVSADFSYGWQETSTTRLLDKFTAKDFCLDARVGPMLSYNHGVVVDILSSITSYSPSLDTYSGYMSLIPKYIMRRDRISFELGPGFGAMIRQKDSPYYSSRGVPVFPDANVDFLLPEANADVYAFVGGGNKLNSYKSMIHSNHWFDGSYSMYGSTLLDNTIQRISAGAGIRGNVRQHFTYDISGGYANWKNAPLDMVYVRNVLVPAIVWRPWSMVWTKVDLGLDLEKFDASASFTYRNSDVVRKMTEGFEPSRFSLQAQATYHWNRRLHVGLDCDYSSSRHCKYETVFAAVWRGEIPWYADLGLNAEYKFNNYMSFWARGGNLMNMPVQRHLCYVERGINFRFGVSLVL